MKKVLPFSERTTRIEVQENVTTGRFFALGCPCEVLVDSTDSNLVTTIVGLAREEAWRIEKKWSRYLKDSMVEQINHSAGSHIIVDDETVRMINFSESLYKLSDGVFDITSGVLRKIWHFDNNEEGNGKGSSKLPSPEEIETIMCKVGWHRVDWQAPVIHLAEGMQLDFGGIGKEYAVDQCVSILGRFDVPVLVNLGGDLACTRAPRNRPGWLVGMDSFQPKSAKNEMLCLSQGAIASSGDTYRYMEYEGKRYGHILDARTGWPVEATPVSVTVMAETCTTAGMLTTLAMTQGAQAEQFLLDQSVQHFVNWANH